MKIPSEITIHDAPVIGAKRGYFITFEGSDGAGKSTQIDLLRQALQKTGFTVRMLREPGGCKISETLRDILKDPKNKQLCPEAELMLMNAARAQLVREVINPALEAGEIVLCDRFYHSTIVYQGFGRQLDLNIIKAMIQLATGKTIPDVTFVLHLSKEDAEKRTIKRGAKDRFEKDTQDFQDRVQAGIEWLASLEMQSNGKIVSISANDSVENIHNEIYRCVAARVSGLPSNALELDKAKAIIQVNKDGTIK